MNWKTKSKIQNLVSLFPSSISYAIYYWIQRNFGGLKTEKTIPVSLSKFDAAMRIWQHIQKFNCDPKGKTFFEVGSGRVPVMPLSYWLMGADSTITIDLNPYMKEELLVEFIDYIYHHRNQVEEIFGPLLIKERLDDLFELYKGPNFSIDIFLDFCNIKYVAPGDAAKTQIKDQSINFHTSYQVLEHIPETVLIDILKEGNRIISNDGLFVHIIDYADHFCYWDETISAINFLQYTELEWDRYAGNRYMYLNRLRHDDFLNMFESSGHNILVNTPEFDQRSLDLLRSNSFQVNERFEVKTEEILSIRSSIIVSQKNT